MQVSNTYYSYIDSIERIDEIFNNSDSSYDYKKSIPSRDSLTYKNGFNVDCSAVFVDIRGSKELSEHHTKPVLAKIYKAYISELVAVLRSHLKISEIFIEGDCVWAVVDSPLQSDIDELFGVAAKACSFIDILNVKLKRKGYTTIEVGVGLSYGTALMIKSGYKGSGINEVVWLGKLVGEAQKLCTFGNKTYLDERLMVSNTFYENLNDHNKSLLSWNYNRQCYHGSVIDISMNEWVEKQRG
jgi:class 3 adenylate cyclase